MRETSQKTSTPSDGVDIDFLNEKIKGCISTELLPARRFLSDIVTLLEQADADFQQGGPDVSKAQTYLSQIRDCTNSEALLSVAQQKLIVEHLEMESQMYGQRSTIFDGDGIPQMMAFLTFINSCRG